MMLKHTFQNLKKVGKSVKKDFKGFIENQVDYLKLWKKNWWLLLLDVIVLFVASILLVKELVDKFILLPVLIIYVLASSINKIYLQIKYIKKYTGIDFLFHAIMLVVSIILVFAMMYMMPAENSTIEGINNSQKFGDYFYFSGVTFFSLGYGDIAPTGVFRYLAVLEVFLGVFFFGNFIALGFNLIYEKVKQDRWEPLKKKVTEELNEQFSGILTDISVICSFREVMVFSREVSNEELWKKDRDIVLGKVKKFAEEGGVNISRSYKENVLKGNFGTLFKKREKFLSTFQIKYKEYLEPDIIIKLIDVQKAFGLIDQKIIIRNKQVDNDWLRIDTDGEVIKIIEKQFQIIIAAIQFMAEKGILKYR